MTRDERIEALAGLLWMEGHPNHPWDQVKDAPPGGLYHFAVTQTRYRARAYIDTAYPELAGENPTHWLAPMEKTDGR